MGPANELLGYVERGGARAACGGPKEKCLSRSSLAGERAESAGLECYWAACHAVGFPAGPMRCGR